METYFSFNTFQGNLPQNQVAIFFMRLQCYSAGQNKVLDGLVKFQTWQFTEESQGDPSHATGSIRHLSECPTWLHCWNFRICLSNHKVKNKTKHHVLNGLHQFHQCLKFQQNLTSGNYSKIQEVLSLIEAIPKECGFPQFDSHD